MTDLFTVFLTSFLIFFRRLGFKWKEPAQPFQLKTAGSNGNKYADLCGIFFLANMNLRRLETLMLF